MRLSFKSVAATAALSAVLAAGLFVSPVMAAQPHMERALAALQEARAQLAAASPNKSGHRAEAMRLVDRAIAETRAGMAAARR